MITPAGLPAWTRTANYAAYGGNTSKRNFLSQGVIDPQTDVGAAEFARFTADLEALVRTCPFAVITFLNRDASPAAPIVECVYMQTGVQLVQYPGDVVPSGFPSAARNGTGDVTFTFASSYTDPYSVSGAFAVKHAGATGLWTTATIVTTDITTTTVRVRCFTDAGAAVGDRRVTLEVY